jgi:hypothetical protein
MDDDIVNIVSAVQNINYAIICPVICIRNKTLCWEYMWVNVRLLSVLLCCHISDFVTFHCFFFLFYILCSWVLYNFVCVYVYYLSSLARKPGLWVRIPLRAWMFSVCVCAFFCGCVQVEALWQADHPSKESYQLSLIKKLRKLSPVLQKQEQAPKCVGATREKKKCVLYRYIRLWLQVQGPLLAAHFALLVPPLCVIPCV